MVILKSFNQPYTLGLDIGIASVGAALLGKEHIIALHVRTFEKAETAKKGESLNKVRREAKSVRRRLRRRAQRMLHLLHIMKQEGLLSETDKKSFSQSIKNLKSPWQLRSEGLDRKLMPIEWAAAIYHILRHRGFQSNRGSIVKENEQTGKMLKNVKENAERLSIGHYRTVGEMVYKDNIFNRAKRNKHGSYLSTFSRSQLVKELQLLFEK